jgi:hypothetical protein
MDEFFDQCFPIFLLKLARLSGLCMAHLFRDRLDFHLDEFGGLARFEAGREPLILSFCRA